MRSWAHKGTQSGRENGPAMLCAPLTDKSFLVLFFKKEQAFFLKEEAKPFAPSGSPFAVASPGVYGGEVGDRSCALLL
jgi:hypothetical protein